jgi:hypothetical protein
MLKEIDDLIKEYLTPEEVAEIDKQAEKEVRELLIKKQEEHKKYCDPQCPRQARPVIQEK